MKPFLTLFLAAILNNTIAQRQNVFDCPTNKGTNYLYVSDGSVKPRDFLGIDSGNMIVFKFGRWFDCCGGNHCLVEGKLFWTIEKKQTSFDILVQRKDSLAALMTYYMVGWDKDVYKLISAEREITGQLTRGKWKVKGKMRLYLISPAGGPDKVVDEIVDGEYKKWIKSKKMKHSRKFFSFD